jgi:hypothetical protein
LGVGGDVRLVVDPGQSITLLPGVLCVASDVGRVRRVVWWAEAGGWGAGRRGGCRRKSSELKL